MDLKTKVTRISISAGITILLAAVGYLAYFIANDTLQPPPEITVTRNLFLEKDSIDIANYKNKVTDLCSFPNLKSDSVFLSLQEDKINDFISEEQYQRLWKRFNFAYTEHFIELTNQYFNQADWNCNSIVLKRIPEIKTNGFVEYDSPIWNSLQGFEDNINWYNQAVNCISKINNVIYWDEYFLYNNLSDINEKRNNLMPQKCKKNINKLMELNNSYDNLKSKSEQYLEAEIKKSNNDFNNQRNYYKDNSRNENYREYYEIENKVNEWISAFNNNSSLMNLLTNYKNTLDYYYY